MTQTVTVNGISYVLYNDFSPPLTVVGASIPAALTDQSYTTYVQSNNDVAGTLTVQLPAPTLPARAIVQYVQFRLNRYRASGVDNDNPFFVRSIAAYDKNAVAHSTSLPASFTQAMWPPFYPTVYTVLTGQFTQFSDGLPMKDVLPNTVSIAFYVYPGSVPGPVQLQDIQTIWAYNTPPTITVTGPADPSTTSKPDVTWTYSDADGDVQRAARLIVIPDGTPSVTTPYGLAGGSNYDPTGATVKAYDSGKVFTGATSLTCAGGLVNGGTYWAYVMVWSDPIAGGDQTSLWSAKQFTVNVTPPPEPVLTITTDQPNSRVLLQAVEGSTATPHADRFDIERSDDDGATWRQVRNATFEGQSLGTKNVGTSGVGWNSPYRVQNTFPNGLTAQWHGALADYTSGVQTFVDQAAASSQRAFRCEIDGTGHLQFVWSQDGSTWANTATATAVTTAGNSLDIWFKWVAVLNTNPWTVKFYESTDGVTWTQLGSTVSGTGPKLMFASNQGVRLDGTAVHTTQNLNGITYSLDVYGDPGVHAVSPNWVGLAPNTASMYDTMGNQWTPAGTAGWLPMVLSVYDYEATPNVVLRYRSRSWRDDPPADVAVSQWVEGSASITDPVLTDTSTVITTDTGDPILVVLAVGDPDRYVLPAVQWRVKDPLEPSLNLPVTMSEWEPERVKVSNVVEGLEASKALVTHGGVRGDRISAKFRTIDKAVYDELIAALTSGRTLLIQGVLGSQWYVQPVGNVARRQMLAQKQVGELFPVRHAFEIDAQFAEVEVP